MVSTPDIRQRQWYPVPRGPDRGRDPPHGATSGRQFFARLGNARRVRLHADQKAVPVTNRINARDRFLPQIAAFGEADGLIVAPDFLRQVLIGDVATVQWRARFDADYLHCFCAAGDRADIHQCDGDLF